MTSDAHDHERSLGDVVVLRIARQEGRVLITNDTDFGDLIFRLGLSHSGVLIFRLRRQGFYPKREWIDEVLARHSEDLGRFVVVTDSGVRVRRE